MLEINEKTEILVYKYPVDMRKSFTGLTSLTKNILNEDPESGRLFVFIGKSKRIVKILKWDRTGYEIYAKKLESSNFKIFTENEKTSINKGKLLQFLDGIPLGIKRKICYK